jgi:UDPglucose 6-dehydrogenase
MSNKVGIVGYGFVGFAVETGLQSVAEIRVYDKYKDTENLDSVVDNSEIIFICLPTPTDFSTGETDLSIIKEELKNINKLSKKSKTIVIKSTVPPGSTESFQKKYPKHTFVFSPEFLTEKNFINDFLEQDRIILGIPFSYPHVNNILKLENLFKKFTLQQKTPAEIIKTQTSTAEMVKYMSNCFLATKVMFFNEMYEICKSMNISYDEAANLTSKDKRIGKSHTQVPGVDGLFGFGGKCFPKDLNSLIFFAKQNNLDPMILESVWTKNLVARQKYDWEDIPGACTSNLEF